MADSTRTSRRQPRHGHRALKRFGDRPLLTSSTASADDERRAARRSEPLADRRGAAGNRGVGRSSPTSMPRPQLRPPMPFAGWSGRTGTQRRQILHDVADLIDATCRRDRCGRVRRHRPADPVHERGRDPRRRELPVLRRSRARCRATGGRCPTSTTSTTRASRHRPGRCDHAVEHAVHAVHLEDRPGARGGVHGGAQTS